MFHSSKIIVVAGISNALAEVLALLDPRESALITYISTYATHDDVGVYLIEFDKPQCFDPDCFQPDVWDLIEDASEMDGIIEAHLAAT
jgi:hypothetical protein